MSSDVSGHELAPVESERAWVACSASTTLGCQGCGATISVTDLVSDVTCPFCKGVQTLDPRWLGAAHQYVHGVEAQLTSLRRSGEDAAVRRRMNPDAMTAIGMSCFGISVAACCGVIVVGHVWPAWNIMAMPEWVFYAVFLGCTVGVVLAAIMFVVVRERVIRRRYRRQVECEVVPALDLRCAGCGAQNQLVAGTLVRSCSYCGASLVKTVRQISRSTLAMAIEVRRRAATIRGAGPHWLAQDRFDHRIRHFLASRHFGPRDDPGPWLEAPRLAVALRGRVEMRDRASWMQGYWPEAAGIFPGQTTFVWGHCRGYPVGVDVMALSRTGSVFLRAYVAAMAMASEEVMRHGGMVVHRSLAGYHVQWCGHPKNSFSDHVMRTIDQVCAQAQRDAALPAPFLATDSPIRRVPSGPARREVARGSNRS
jgi:DNA-directed RNA polymerase subunit RPC12/RpoP